MEKRVVLCNPEFFDVDYIINPWMKGNVHKINKELAKNQWLEFKRILISKGIFVKEIKGKKGFPDMVFTANHGIRIKDFFVVSNFRFKERRGEIDVAIPQILEGEKLSRIDCPYFWEGEAELFKFKENLYIGGYGKRGTLEALRWFEEIFDIKVIPLELIDERFYHLDTCLTMRNKKVYLFRGAFSEKSLANLEKAIGKERIFYLSKEAAENFAANCIQLENCVIVGTKNKNVLDELKNLFQTEIISLDMSEFIKSGGSVFCSKLFL